MLVISEGKVSRADLLYLRYEVTGSGAYTAGTARSGRASTGTGPYGALRSAGSKLHSGRGGGRCTRACSGTRRGTWGGTERCPGRATKYLQCTEGAGAGRVLL